MVFNCFKASGNSLDDLEAPRPLSAGQQPGRPRPRPMKTKSYKNSFMRRSGSAISESSTSSNESISRLPPCKGLGCPIVESMMMPIRVKEKPSRPMRLAHPKLHSELIFDMKAAKKSRDWKAWAVFDDDDFLPVEEVAKKRRGNQRICTSAATDNSNVSENSSL